MAQAVLAQTPSPSPTAEAAEPNQPGDAAINCGAMQFSERDKPDKRDFVCRLSATITTKDVVIFGRGDWTRTQDVPEGSTDLLDVKTFASVEALVGVRRDIVPHLAGIAFAGVTWNRDHEYAPSDPRLWTAAVGLRYSIPGRGYVVAALGQHGPVGGSAFLGSVVYELNPGASLFADVAIPLDATRFAVRPYTLKTGMSALIKRKKFKP